MKFKEGDVVRVKDGDTKTLRGWSGLTGVVAGIEPYLVRKIFRTDYLVVMHGSLHPATFKENEIELYHA